MKQLPIVKKKFCGGSDAQKTVSTDLQMSLSQYKSMEKVFLGAVASHDRP